MFWKKRTELILHLKQCKEKVKPILSSTFSILKQYLNTIHVSLLWSLNIAVRVIILVILTVSILIVLDKLKLLEPFKIKQTNAPTIVHTNTVNNSKPSLDNITTTDIDSTIKLLEGLGK